MKRPDLTIKQVLAWADAHHARTGEWPVPGSGPIPATSETWYAVAAAMRRGRRGLSKVSLFQLLAAKRNIGPAKKPTITIERVLKWADQYYRETGNWPLSGSGPIPGASGLTWHSVVTALRSGKVGAKKTSLFQLLKQERGVHRHVRRPQLTVDQILIWADEHHKRTGKWPDDLSGKVIDAPHENWRAINYALRHGLRSLPQTTLAKLLKQARQIYRKRPPLSEGRILQWARDYKRTHGHWPKPRSGPIPGSNGDTWLWIQSAVQKGTRGLKARKSMDDLFVD